MYSTADCQSSVLKSTIKGPELTIILSQPKDEQNFITRLLYNDIYR